MANPPLISQSLYDEQQSSMDELGGFEPTDTTGFINIESIRIKKCVPIFIILIPSCSPVLHRWAQANIRRGQAGVTPADVYGTRV